jgi:hypothetical protein
MRSDRLTAPSHAGSRTGSAIQSEPWDLELLRLENKQLKELVIQLSQIVFKNVMEAERPRSDRTSIACPPTRQLASAPSLWPAGNYSVDLPVRK